MCSKNMRTPVELNEISGSIRREWVKTPFSARNKSNLEHFLWSQLESRGVTDPDEIRKIMSDFGVDLRKG